MEVDKVAQAARASLERRREALKIISLSPHSNRDVVDGYKPSEVEAVVEEVREELLASLTGDELAGTRAAIESLDPLTRLQRVWVYGGVVATAESTARALDAFSAQLTYLKEPYLELVIVSTPGGANFFLYGEREAENKQRKPLDVACTDGCVISGRTRGQYHYVVQKPGYKQQDFPMNLWNVEGPKVSIRCLLYAEGDKDGPVACDYK